MRRSGLKLVCFAVLSAIMAGAAAPAPAPDSATPSNDRPGPPLATCKDPTLRGKAGPVCRIVCAGFYIDVLSGGTVLSPRDDKIAARFSIDKGKLNGEGIFTTVTVLGNADTACAFSGFEMSHRRAALKSAP